MALKSIGILIAVCATLTTSVHQEVKPPLDDGYYHGLNNPNFPARIDFTSNEDVTFTGHHDHTPHLPHDSNDSQESGHHGHHKPNLHHDSQESGHHNHHKPHFPHGSEESQQSQQMWEHKKPHHQSRPIPHFPHNFEWHIPHFSENHEQSKDGLEARRRPIFMPYLPYHPYYPHAYPSHNDEEFETIEALKRGNYYHGSHNPNFPLPQDDSQENEHKKPFFHGYHNPHFPLDPDNSEETSSSEESYSKPFFHLPHFKPSHKEPDQDDSQENEHKKPFFHGFHNPHSPLDSDSSKESSSSEELYGKPFFHLPHFKPFHKKPSQDDSESNEEHFKLPSILQDLHNFFHHGHGKPHDKVPINEDQVNEEGSGEEEIVPLSGAAEVPLIRDDNEMEDEKDDPNNVPAINFRSFLEPKKSIPVECDALNMPRYSCYNCYNYLVCKPEGGKIKACKDPYAPYCNNGICSATPGPQCSNL